MFVSRYPVVVVVVVVVVDLDVSIFDVPPMFLGRSLFWVPSYAYFA